MAQVQNQFELQACVVFQLLGHRVKQEHEPDSAQCEKVDKVAYYRLYTIYLDIDEYNKYIVFEQSQHLQVHAEKGQFRAICNVKPITKIGRVVVLFVVVIEV
jgi:hypothetical protein